jgi:multimeric flavodoxin WrbA
MLVGWSTETGRDAVFPEPVGVLRKQHERRIFMINVLGIHSSPIKKGNTAWVLDYALQEAEKAEGVKTQSVALTGLKIADCNHCNWCMKKQTPEKLCSIEDDANPILEKVQKCDILVLATPVYFSRLSGTMACFLDRTRCFTHGSNGHLALKGKIGVALAVGWRRNLGMETTLASLHSGFLVHEMIAPSCHDAGALYGAAVVSGQRDEAFAYKRDKLGVKDDREGLNSTKLLMDEAVRTFQKFKNLR